MERCLIGLDAIRPEFDEISIEKMEMIVAKEYMSSEESEFEEVDENDSPVRRLKCFKIRWLSWERTKLRTMKEYLDKSYYKSITKHVHGMIKVQD